MADITVPVPIQLAQGTTVGLIILQGTNPLNSNDSQVTGTLAPLVNMAPVMSQATINNNNNNNNNNNTVLNNNNINTINNNNLKKTKESAKIPKTIKPAPAKGATKKASKNKSSTGTTPPLKPPKKERDEDNEILRCKRRLDFAKLGLPFNRANPVAVARRNERERRRVKQINSTFLSLRDHLPSSYCPHKNPNKMSKVETLRGAIDYINSLQNLLEDYDSVHAALTDPASPPPSSATFAPATNDHHQQQQQQHIPVSLPQPDAFSRLDEMSTSEVMENVHRILSVQPTDTPTQTAPCSLTSPTGSTCSSVGSSNSSSGSVYRSETATPTADPSYYSNMQHVPCNMTEDVLYHHQHAASQPPIEIKEEDLILFAQSWL